MEYHLNMVYGPNAVMFHSTSYYIDTGIHRYYFHENEVELATAALMPLVYLEGLDITSIVQLACVSPLINHGVYHTVGKEKNHHRVFLPSTPWVTTAPGFRLFHAILKHERLVDRLDQLQATPLYHEMLALCPSMAFPPPGNLPPDHAPRRSKEVALLLGPSISDHQYKGLLFEFDAADTVAVPYSQSAISMPSRALYSSSLDYYECPGATGEDGLLIAARGHAFPLVSIASFSQLLLLHGSAHVFTRMDRPMTQEEDVLACGLAHSDTRIHPALSYAYCLPRYYSTRTISVQAELAPSTMKPRLKSIGRREGNSSGKSPRKRHGKKTTIHDLD